MKLKLIPFLFLISHSNSLISQASSIGLQLGFGKYIYEDQSRTNLAFDSICWAGLPRSEELRWVTPEMGVLYQLKFDGWAQLSAGIKMNTKGKDIISISNLSCPDKLSNIQIRTTYFHLPVYISTNPNSWIGLQIGYIYGFPLWHREIHNDQQKFSISKPEYKKLFGISRELVVELSARFTNNYRVNGGVLFGRDKLMDPIDHGIVSYWGYRVSMVYDISLSRSNE